jgi:hypothetical protein
MGDSKESVKFSFVQKPLESKKRPQKSYSVQERADSPRRELVVGVRDGSLQPLEPECVAPPSTRRIIPKQDNTFHIKRAHYMPSFVPQDDHAASSVNATAGIKTTFETARHDTAEAQQNVTYGLIKRKRVEAVNGETREGTASRQRKVESESEIEKLRRDLEFLPPQASLEAYEVVPVEVFGEALLRGMGWHEGRGLGRTGAGDVVPKETVRRPHRLGLGASAAAASVAPLPKDKKQSITNPPPTTLATTSNTTHSHSAWLTLHIRVKFIDKRAHNGTLYLRKGVVVEVKSPTICDVYFKDLGKVVHDIDESMLETAVPSSKDTPILVVAGAYKGRKGRLLDRDSSKDTARVQLLSDMSIHTLALDDVAEYIET